MSSPNKKHIHQIPAISQKELRSAVQEGLAELAAEPIVCCAKVVWNDPHQLRYCDPRGDGTVIRVNLMAQTDAGRFDEAALILKQRHPGVEWVIA